MKKRISAIGLMVAITVAAFSVTGCNGNNDKEQESKAESVASDTSANGDFADGEEESKTEESSQAEMADYIPDSVKNTESYKKMIATGKGDVVIIDSNDYQSEYYMFEDGEIGVVDKSTEKDNEYTYMKYTVGNTMYTVDVGEKMYAETDMNSKEGGSTDKKKFLSDLTNYMYYGIEYMGMKDGVEIYNIPQYEDESVEGTDEEVASVSDGANSATESSEGSAVVSEVADNEKTESQASEESSKEEKDVKRYIKVTDTGLVMYDYLNDEKQSTITVTIRKVTDADKKQFTIEGCKKYEESSVADSSYNEADLPDVPDFGESVESKISETESKEVSKAE